MPYTRATLLAPARSLCNAFADGSSTSKLLTYFTNNPLPTIHEHGHPSFAPFLGRTFTGRDGIGRYFELLSEHLSISNMSLDPEDQWIVDTETMAISIRGSARFTWKSTGQGWDETFCYRIGMAEDLPEEQNGDGGILGGGEKGKLKVQEYIVWSDTGAAYLARTGKLKDVQNERERSGKETSRSRERRRSGCGEVVGGGLGAFGSCR